MAIGEIRTLADVLIENARLLATIEGKDQVIHGKDDTIAELKDDRTFLREEVREGRLQRKDVKDIASRMLEAMQNIAMGRKLPPKAPQDDTITATVIDLHDPEPPQGVSVDNHGRTLTCDAIMLTHAVQRLDTHILIVPFAM